MDIRAAGRGGRDCARGRASLCGDENDPETGRADGYARCNWEKVRVTCFTRRLVSDVDFPRLPPPTEPHVSAATHAAARFGASPVTRPRRAPLGTERVLLVRASVQSVQGSRLGCVPHPPAPRAAFLASQLSATLLNFGSGKETAFLQRSMGQCERRPHSGRPREAGPATLPPRLPSFRLPARSPPPRPPSVPTFRLRVRRVCVRFAPGPSLRPVSDYSRDDFSLLVILRLC